MSYFSILIGQVAAYSLDTYGTRHAELLIFCQGQPYRASINIWSKRPPHRLKYGFRAKMRHPMLRLLYQQREGFYTGLPKLKLDYRKQGMIHQRSMGVLPDTQHGPRNDLLDMILPRMRQLIAEPKRYKLVLFGDRWGPEPRTDWYFDFKPSSGLHNIHMNGGQYPDRHGEDGGMFIYDRKAKAWEGHFFAFQSAKW